MVLNKQIKEMTIKKYIILALSSLTLAGCTSDEEVSQEESRLPLTFETSLSASRPVTRAEGGAFAASDELLCYVRHMSSTDVVKTKMVTIKNGAPTEALYWDDFSESTDDDSKDLRTNGHGLQSYYGYCYNGGTPTTALDKKTGVLGWTTAADQSADGAMKANDLIWSKAQSAVTYQHAKDNRAGLTVPYTHAMSKFTIVIVAGDGFKSEVFNNTTVTLKDMNLTGTFTAPTSTVEVTGTTTDVQMYRNSVSTTTDNKPCCAYEAVAVPLRSMSSGNLLATINGMDGNNYDVYLTDAILTAWASGITEAKSQSGINYKLTITLNKQAVEVEATLADWSDVSAAITAEIKFTADVTSNSGTTGNSLSSGDSFTLWKTGDLLTLASAEKRTVTFDGTNFTCDSKLYWQNAADDSYFRALAIMTTTGSGTSATTTIAATESTTANQGTDVLWGTTAEHKGNATIEYKEGVIIKPRTGAVPLIFKHAMSNVVVELATSNDASAVDFSKATITISNLYTNGTINIADGEVKVPDGSTTSTVAVTVSGATIMVPQTIDTNAKLVINLNDNTDPDKSTTYSLTLNTCKDSNGTVITKWAGGNKYTYTITLKKQDISFRALVQDWDKNTGSGDATLDWD